MDTCCRSHCCISINGFFGPALSGKIAGGTSSRSTRHFSETHGGSAYRSLRSGKRDFCQDKRDEMAKLKGPGQLGAGYEAGDETLTQSTFFVNGLLS